MNAKPLRPSKREVGTDQRLPSCLRTREGWARFFSLRRPPEPHLHQIEPTNHCPYACVMCPRPRRMTRPTGFMELSLFEKVIDEAATFAEPTRSKEIELFHFGESLLHPQIDTMVGFASGRGLNVTLSVNAPQLDPGLAERILRNKPFRIIISLDGNDQETYEAARGRAANFDKAVHNIEALAAMHRAMRSGTCISVRMIELNINRGQVQAFRERWAQQDIEVEIRRFFPWGEKELAGLGEFEKYPPGMPCPFPWQYLVVQWNGDVVPCCRDYNAAVVLGNVKEATLREIWNSERYEDFRKQMATGQFRDNTICAPCLDLYFTESSPQS